jgi:hypothetical protein
MKFIGAAALATRQRRERRHGSFDRNEAFAVVERLQKKWGHSTVRRLKSIALACK